MATQSSIEGGTPFPQTFAKEMLVIESGEGVYLRDRSGRRYLDFGSGISVNALGYGRKDVAEIAYRQMQKLIHISNLFATDAALEFGRKLLAQSSFAAVHFGNSGTEATETAIKFARLYSRRKKGPGNHRLLCFTNAFHGRTMGALSCTPNKKYQEPFEPLVPGVETLEYNDSRAVRETVDDGFAGIIVETVQGEGGLRMMTEEFAAALNEACRKHDVILIADEVQTGLGRTGYAFSSEAVGLKPDIVALSKPLAGGLPLSATLINAGINKYLALGEHGTTFGGGPVTTAVASYIWDTITDKQFLAGVREKGRYLAEKLEGICRGFDEFCIERRGAGLLQGIVVREAGLIAEIIAAAREEGLLILRSGPDVLRIAPPLVISGAEIDEGVRLLENALQKTFGRR
jgi:acetylornithine/N-succinyldiaminopimelate aminotransferase